MLLIFWNQQKGDHVRKKIWVTQYFYIFSSDIDKGFYCNHNFSDRVLRVFSDRVFRIGRQTGTKQYDKYINIFNKLVYLTSRQSNKSCEIVILAHIFDYHPICIVGTPYTLSVETHRKREETRINPPSYTKFV